MQYHLLDCGRNKIKNEISILIVVFNEKDSK